MVVERELISEKKRECWRGRQEEEEKKGGGEERRRGGEGGVLM